MDALTIYSGFVVLAMVAGVYVFILAAAAIARSLAAKSSNPGPLRPLYWQERERTQAELLARVPADLRRRGLSRAVYTGNFSGQREFSHLELFPGELYEYVQRWDNGRLTGEYVSQNGFSLVKG